MITFTRSSSANSYLGKWSNYITSGIKVFLALFFLLFLTLPQNSQAQSPCNAHRWNAGDGWRFNTTTQKWEAQVLSSPNLQPKGIIRCASSAETENGLQAYAAKYDPTKFAINTNLTNCFNQQDKTRGTTVTGPTTAKDVVWFNYDIRPLAGTYQFQIITNDQIGWALYYVDPAFAGPMGTGTNNQAYPTSLSGFTGNCTTDLSHLQYADCGISGNGWSTITVPSLQNRQIIIWPCGL
ncbi:MAG: hypothetical protein ACR2KZ_13130 [Segetibacter sp.]